MEPTWERRELPILRALVEACENAPYVRYSAELVEATGLEQHEVILAVRALEDGGYVAVSSRTHAQEPPGFDVVGIRPLPPARRATGQWPPDAAYDALVSGLEARLAATTDPAVRGRLERLRDALLGLGREVTGELIADVLKRGL